MNQLLDLARPNWRTLLLFVLITLLMPVPFLMREPTSQMSNDHWVWKYKVYESLFTTFVGGHASGFDVFLGMVESFFFTNLIGLPLLLIYYLVSHSVVRLIFYRRDRSS
jgi:hypothetical protein